MNLALRRGYGFAYGPHVRPVASASIGGLGQDNQLCTEVDPDTGLCTAYENADTLAATPAYQITDSSGVGWSCDQNGNCCDPNGNCQQGPPTVATTAPAGAAPAVVKSASSANQSTAQLVAALASAAAIARGAVTGGAAVVPPGSMRCPSGVVVPIGSSCPTTPVTGASAPLIAGISNSTLGLIAVAFVALMVMGRGRR